MNTTDSVPTSPPVDLLPLIEAAASAHGLPPRLVAAIVRVESGGNPWAHRYEREFDRRYNREPGGFIPRGCSGDTEEVGRAQSWGLMQIMGETARYLGFRGWFPELCSPEVGLRWGCDYLARLASRYSREPWEVICRAYNGGPGNRHNKSNTYPDKVLAACGGAWPDKE